MKMLFTFVAAFLLNIAAGVSVAAQSVVSAQPVVRPAPLAVGEMAPDFTLEDFRFEIDDWRKVTLSAARDNAAVVLVFYRGHW